MDILKDKLTLQSQEEILADSLKREIPLSELLGQKGLTYDALRYREYSDIVQKPEAIESLDDKEKLTPTIPAISFFSGAGGLNLGFEYAGFDNIVSVENNQVFCHTLRQNNPKKIIIIGLPIVQGMCVHTKP
jgi:DNA (cytosine-5)-methyltransferase 1